MAFAYLMFSQDHKVIILKCAWFMFCPTGIILCGDRTSNGGDHLFLGAIYLWGIVVPSAKEVINLPRTYEKLHCNENHIG